MYHGLGLPHVLSIPEKKKERLLLFSKTAENHSRLQCGPWIGMERVIAVTYTPPSPPPPPHPHILSIVVIQEEIDRFAHRLHRLILVPRGRAPFGQHQFLVLTKRSAASGDENVIDSYGCLPFGQKIRKFRFEVKW